LKAQGSSTKAQLGTLAREMRPGGGAKKTAPWKLGEAMADIRSPTVLYVKGALFLVVGVMASAALLLEHPSLRVALLLALAIWAFARAYYFAFYVIQHYIDDQYRFAGLGSFVAYAIRRWRDRERQHP
jgi:hypothetical protein